MKKRILAFCTLLLLLSGGVAAGSEYSATVGPKGVSIKHFTDLSLHSRFIVVEPPWHTYYFHSAWWQMQTERTELENGDYRLTLSHENPVATLKEWSAEVREDKVIVTLEAFLNKDIPAKVEYSMMMIPEILSRNAYWIATQADGNIIEAAIDPEWKKHGVGLASDLVKLELYSPYGLLTIELEYGDTFTLADRRGYGFDVGIDVKTPGLWIGTGEPLLKFGEPFKHRYSVSFEPAEDLIIAVPAEIDVSQTVVEERTQIQRPVPADNILLPVPKQWEASGSDYAPAEVLPLYVNAPELDRGELERFNRAADRVFERDLGFDVRNVAAVPQSGINVSIGIPSPEGLMPPEHQEGYTLMVTEDGCSIAANTARGAFYGMQTLKHLYKNGVFCGSYIYDYPDIDVRGAMIHVDKDSLRVHGEIIEKVIAPMKYNQLYIECEKAAWDSTASVHYPWSISKDDLRAIIDMAEDNYMEVIPLFQSFGHCEWMFNNGQNRQMAENPSNPYACNPSHPDTYPYLTKAMDEMLELFGNPRYLHIGHDEVGQPYNYPFQEENKQKGAAEVIMDDVLFWHNFCKERNMRMIMWHDMFLGASSANPVNGVWGLGNRLEELPKDIIFAFWNYSTDINTDNINRLHELGFDVLACTYFDTEGIASFTEICKDMNMFGVMETNWSGYFNFDHLLERYFQDVAAYITQGAYAWNCSRAVNDFEPGRILDDILLPDGGTHSAAGAVVDISSVANLDLSPVGKPFLFDPSYGFENLASYDFSHCDVEFKLPVRDGKLHAIALKSRINPLFPEKVEGIEINRKADEIYFLHSFRSNGTTVYAAHSVAAEYVINYEDGTQEVFPVLYKRSIALPSDQDYTQFLPWRHNVNWIWNGERVNMWYGVWKNPHPEKNIATIDIRCGEEQFPFYCFGISLGDR